MQIGKKRLQKINTPVYTNGLWIKHFIHRLLHWEYWPQWLVYAPIIPVYLYYACKAKHFYFPLTANPDIENGGYLMESKYTIYKKLPKAIQPTTIYINHNTAIEQVLQQLQTSTIDFPCIAKPDIGGKGIAVKLLHTYADVEAYHKQMPIAYLVQEKVNYNNEVGIFYAKKPSEINARITGIVLKQNMSITGNGQNTLEELVNVNSRLYYQRTFIQQAFTTEWKTIIPANQILQLSCIGNHARGSQFFDVSNKITPALTNVIHHISTQFNTFYFGRYDIMFHNWNDLYEGKNYSIIEVNGSGSEPTHIYDAKKPIWQAWKIIIQHWKIGFLIATEQMQNGVQPLSFKAIKALEKQYKELEEKLKKIF